MQAIVETGWFRFGGSVPAWKNNFAGIGATDTNPAPAAFPDARTGVRAQIQHLRAYADPGATTCSVPPLHRPCVDPRFALVVPKGKAPDLEPDGQRQLGDVVDVRNLHPQSLQRGARLPLRS